jgi:hypothetical protein
MYPGKYWIKHGVIIQITTKTRYGLGWKAEILFAIY